jgi:hypothetical protein
MARLISKIARAVSYAHERGVIHRDLKPSNIMVDRLGEPRILDFGVARRYGAMASATEVVPGGTPLYMAPEQFEFPQDAGPGSDIYALGLILFELLVGTPPPPPSKQDDAGVLAARVLPLPRELNPDIPEPLQRICLKACETKVEDRYSKAGHLADDLDRFVADQPVAARPRIYASLVLDGIRSHLDDLALWESEGLITRREHDVLAKKYEHVAEMDSHWVPDARRLRWGPTLAHLGGWFVVVSAVLLPVFYWKRMLSWERIAGLGVPTLMVNLVGLVSWLRGRRLIGTIFCSVGVILLPVFLVVLMSELHILEYRQGPEYELFPSSPWFNFCNIQILVAVLAMLSYSVVLLVRTKRGLFSILTTVSIILTYSAVMLLLGMKDWLAHERFASVACWYWPVVLGWYALAQGYERSKLQHLAYPPYVGAAAGFLGILCIVALDAPRSWWHIDDPNQKRIAQDLLFIVIGLICLAVAWTQDRSKSVSRRIMAGWFFRLVPPMCVIPLSRLEYPLRELKVKALVIFQIPGAEFPEVYLTEILVLVACLSLVALAVALQLRWYLYYGLIHFATSLVMFTGQHFQEYLSWPVAVMIIGSAVMLAGAAIETRRSRFGLRAIVPRLGRRDNGPVRDP